MALRATRDRLRPMKTPPDLTVYYDGTCPICGWEIDLYNRMRGAERIHWFDLTGADAASLGPGLTPETAAGKFHVRDAAGTLVSGGRAFVEIWARLPALHWAARLGRTAVGHWVLERAYRVFLRILPALRRVMGERVVTRP